MYITIFVSPFAIVVVAEFIVVCVRQILICGGKNWMISGYKCVVKSFLWN
jgi:hypothetical protein